MRFTQSIGPAILLLAAGVAQAASGWGFDDGSIQIAAKKGESIKEKYVALPQESLPPINANYISVLQAQPKQPSLETGLPRKRQHAEAGPDG